MNRDKSKTFKQTVVNSHGLKESQPLMINRHSESYQWEWDPNYIEKKRDKLKTEVKTKKKQIKDLRNFFMTLEEDDFILKEKVNELLAILENELVLLKDVQGENKY